MSEKMYMEGKISYITLHILVVTARIWWSVNKLYCISCQVPGQTCSPKQDRKA